jgi:hypothetical protein
METPRHNKRIHCEITDEDDIQQPTDKLQQNTTNIIEDTNSKTDNKLDDPSSSNKGSKKRRMRYKKRRKTKERQEYEDNNIRKLHNVPSISKENAEQWDSCEQQFNNLKNQIDKQPLLKKKIKKNMGFIYDKKQMANILCDSKSFKNLLNDIITIFEEHIQEYKDRPKKEKQNKKYQRKSNRKLKDQSNKEEDDEKESEEQHDFMEHYENGKQEEEWEEEEQELERGHKEPCEEESQKEKLTEDTEDEQEEFECEVTKQNNLKSLKDKLISRIKDNSASNKQIDQFNTSYNPSNMKKEGQDTDETSKDTTISQPIIQPIDCFENDIIEPIDKNNKYDDKYNQILKNIREVFINNWMAQSRLSCLLNGTPSLVYDDEDISRYEFVNYDTVDQFEKKIEDCENILNNIVLKQLDDKIKIKIPNDESSKYCFIITFE